ncbi:alpha/beta fold hydrolase [Flavobacteriaceae bacterium M23B6Z8]
MKRFKKILRYISYFILLIITILIIGFYWLSKVSSDQKIKDSFEELGVHTKIRYLEYDSKNVRVVSSVNFVRSKPTLIFIHGSIGSSLDFKDYWKNPYLQKHFNLVSYDRIGYAPDQDGEVLNSIKKETEVLQKIVDLFKPSQLILVGYSYGGPIALNYALQHEVNKIALIAPAIFAEYEMIPSLVNIYKIDLFKPLIPDVWKSASKEKLSHQVELKKFENSWKDLKEELLLIHGDNDWIVPFENSSRLSKQIPSSKLITLSGEGHGLVWSSAEEIQEELLKFLQ